MLKKNTVCRAHLRLSASVIAIAAVFAVSAAYAQSEPQQMETIVVTGFRQSLEKALDMKRQSTDSTDSILAEDIAKFPDLNVSESLQRIPGVAINRTAGEGREISVRGLGPDFTRVRINGMEALATAGSSSVEGTNRGRAFDFNVFASELFTALTVHKSNSADVEEGSLGATVDLKTAHPFDHPGFVFSASAQAGYNDLAGSVNPRVAALVSDTFMGGHLGVLFSGAFASRNIVEDGYSTVRFMNDNTPQSATHASQQMGGCAKVYPATTNTIYINGQPDTCSTSQRFHSVMGSSTAGTAGGTPTEYDIVNEAFHPRFPRYDLITDHSKRTGLTGSVQWQPDDDTLFTLDALYADFQVERHEYYMEANSFSANFKSKALGGAGTPYSYGVGAIDVTNYTLDTATNNITQMTADHVGLRAEHFLGDIDSKFEQLTLDGSHSFTNSFKVHALAGWSESHMRNPVQTTLTYDFGGPSDGSGGDMGYSYDFSGGYTNIPTLKYGSIAGSNGSVTDPTTGWFLSQVRERADYNFNSFRTAQGDFSWDALDSLKLTGGIDYKGYGYRTASLQRSNGTTSNQDYVIPADMRAANLANYTSTVTLKGLSAGAGAATTWLVPNIAAWNNQFHIWDPTAEGGAFAFGIQPALGSNGSVHENDLGFWLQADWDTQFYGVPFRGNIGARYVNTDSESVGYSYNAVAKAVVPADVKQSYHDFLPSVNMVFEPSDNFLVRIAGAYAMARPGLTNMLPGASVSLSGANRGVKVGNPGLRPYRSKNIDLAFEWYYHTGSMFSVAFFYKHIDTLVQTIQQEIVYHNNPFGLPDSLAVAACGSAYAAPPATGCNENAIWSFSSPMNTKGSPLYGSEINWQQQLDFLPHPFDSFGLLANATFVQAKQYYYNSNGTVNTYADLSGLSHTSYNATVYYDDTIFQARVSAAFRSKYLAGINPGNLNDQRIVAATFNLDASASYKIDENFSVTADGLNLTNEVENQYVDSVGQRPYVLHQFGREFFVGIRFNY